ncbi:MAG TPA: M24 family metallopeptidase [Gaiellaceae bacterium]|nr:M24 family metallopeptidase [Gaiellaceae bacterium]
MARPITLRDESERAKLGLIPPIPLEVWEARIDACRGAMRADGLDVLLVYSAGTPSGGYEWARYLANYVDATPLWASEVFIAIPLHGAVTLWTTWPLMVERAKEFSPVEDIRLIEVWAQAGRERHGAFAATLRGYLDEIGVTSGRIGFGHGGRGGGWMASTPEPVVRAVREAASDGSFVDASQLLWSLVRVKSEYDIGQLRRASEVNCVSLGQALANVGEGTSEAEILADKIRYASTLGAEFADFDHGGIAVTHPQGLRPLFVTDYRFKRGDMFMVDSWCRIGGFESDIGRVVVIGEPSERQLRCYEATMEIARHMEDALRPGVTARELWEIKDRETKAAGYTITIPLAGHGAGISRNEDPYFVPWEASVIEENMTVAIDVGVFDPPEACFIFEETYIVHADRNERITPLTSELYVA